MIEDLDFSDTKQVRKTLLITSFIGICFAVLVSHSTGNIEFLGFKIPVKDAPVIPFLIGCMIVYEMIVLIIRYNDEELREIYKRRNAYIRAFEPNTLSVRMYEAENAADDRFPVHPVKVQIVKHGVKFIDIFFPLILGSIAILVIIFY
jgi:hypothetical protein